MAMQVEQIIALAEQTSGLKAVIEPHVLEALTVLVNASNEEGQLSEVGEQRWQGMLVRQLGNYLKITDYLGRHPALLERPIEQPMFVFGLPRTGTTLTINLLSADPGRRCFLRWESLDPVPPAQPGALRTDPRCLAEQARIDQVIELAPHIAAVHYEDADSPSECQFNMACNFTAQLFDSNLHIPTYRQWFFNTDYVPTFRFHKRFLQLLQEHNGGQWTLKNPWHPLFLDALHEVYPDAQLVMTHRDPVEVVGSACSLLRVIRPTYSDAVNLRDIADLILETFDLMIERQNAFRARHGAQAIFDIHYAEQLRDPIAQMEKLYAHFGTPFTPEVRGAMQAKLAANPKDRFGKHHYTLEEFGLSAGEIRERYRDYCERFDIPTK